MYLLCQPVSNLLCPSLNLWAKMFQFLFYIIIKLSVSAWIFAFIYSIAILTCKRFDTEDKAGLGFEMNANRVNRKWSSQQYCTPAIVWTWLREETPGICGSLTAPIREDLWRHVFSGTERVCLEIFVLFVYYMEKFDTARSW